MTEAATADAAPDRADPSRLVRAASRLDARAVWIWALTLGLILFLGFDGGGYDLIVRSDAAIVVWWLLLLGAVLGLLPSAQVGPAGWLALALLLLLVVWGTLSSGWSLSTERTVNEASRLVAYLGVLALALLSFSDWRRVIRHVVGAVATAIVAIVVMALLTRLRPDFIPAAETTGQVLPGARARLSWPLNYWNALGALVALGGPLLLALATSTRLRLLRSLAAAALPLMILCGYLTFSRGAAIAGSAGLIVFFALTPQRIPRLLTALVCAGGGVALVAAAVHRHAIENGLTTSAASQEGSSLLVLVIVVCVAVGLLQAAITLLLERPLASRLVSIPRRAAGGALIAALVVAVIVALALGAPHHLDHAWQSFKRPNQATLHQDTLNRFTALSGNGRYTYWKTSIDALGGHWWDGYGLGTFQLVWLPRAPFLSYVQNAHSLYVETLVELGIPGLVLMIGFLISLLISAARRLRDADLELRCLAAAITAGIVAFATSAGFDWIWQVPVLPVTLLLLSAGVLTPAAGPERMGDVTAADVAQGPPRRRRLVFAVAARLGAATAALAALILIGIPLARTTAVRQSQADVNSGRPAAALSAARTAANVEPNAATPALQEALVAELLRDRNAALSAAERATSAEPDNWSAWLVRSRLEAEAGHSGPAIQAYERARSLNPRSPLFAR